jgi:hypothetical protein
MGSNPICATTPLSGVDAGGFCVLGSHLGLSPDPVCNPPATELSDTSQAPAPLLDPYWHPPRARAARVRNDVFSKKSTRGGTTHPGGSMLDRMRDVGTMLCTRVGAGTAENMDYPNYRDLLVRRYTNQLMPDGGFGVDGRSVTNLGGADDCAAAAVGPDGKLAVAGFVLTGGGTGVRSKAEGVTGRGAAAQGQTVTRYVLGASPLLKGPKTFALKAVRTRSGTRGRFCYRVNALTRKATVTIKVFQRTRVKQTIRLGLIAANKDLSRIPLVTLKRGQYTRGSTPLTRTDTSRSRSAGAL